MVTAITQGVKISVDTVYQEEYSNPEKEHFMFAYQISVENLSDYSIQLMRRQWFIFDSNGTQREVEGEGVVGIQPVIEPGESYSYVSGCNLTTDMGSMSGNYLMHRTADESDFTVDIPEFQLIVPYRLN
ncbi:MULTISPECIES: Co2+/Mg2+ efflux protein ApaG [Pedobacter]|uniref:ApaG protein n=1 Tax=Pedobacter cryoconitis TaxID=188932 RepID=A0A127VIA8_9SPHI|nr:Co2+/Mg2+ efflux protein ApaG [Pedobacter cryoconitis]AMQ01056.1 Cobalt transporter [Pedobacter cryoconitis]MBB5623124.1 ApaG protein [Pedobacter cryoconitis]MBB5648537.1 ApaG protein [Pedobacter cryoconitis]RAJ34286.1 ApaG protein [Pedobacter cryoconitis]